jgi:5-methylcytosine-specific restriction endonuclease McrA
MTAPIRHRRNRLVSHDRLRRQVFQRDHGTCSLCGRDCEALRKNLRSLSPEARRLERLRLGIPEGQSWTWEADHILPVAEGGTDLLTNLRTLCPLCHKGITAGYASARATGRRAAAVSEIGAVFGG